ncbi:MAG: RsmD family RNA methyltransferase [Candidatus ainarchaeum sp.]|nr:RsmD family RNA methyltransferase [Candidatus ainarchaeum sp.]
MIFLTEGLAKEIIAGRGEETELSLDLGRSRRRVKRKLLLGIPLEKVRGDYIYIWNGRMLSKAAIASEHYYRLRMFSGIPVLEIDGLRMQLVKEFKTPMEYGKLVAAKLDVGKSDRVLDTCAGLGYTAIAAAARGAEVLTFEKDQNVVEIAKINPWSRELFSDEKIEFLEGDVLSGIRRMDAGRFDKIVHDPPRFSLAGELYSLGFYRELFRVAKKGALLFHYAGNPGRGKGRSIGNGVAERLEKAGWKKIRRVEKLQGVLARKL